MTGVTNSKLFPQRMPALNSPKQNMHATKAELAQCTTSARLSKYAQSQKLSSLTSHKYWIFPHSHCQYGDETSAGRITLMLRSLVVEIGNFVRHQELTRATREHDNRGKGMSVAAGAASSLKLQHQSMPHRCWCE